MSSSDSFTVIVLVGLALACFLLWLAFRILKWTTKKVIVPAAKITGEVVGTTAQITTDIAVSAATAVAREHDKSHGTDYATSIEEKREGIVQFAEKAGKAVGGGAVVAGVAVVAGGLVGELGAEIGTEAAVEPDVSADNSGGLIADGGKSAPGLMGNPEATMGGSALAMGATGAQGDPGRLGLEEDDWFGAPEPQPAPAPLASPHASFLTASTVIDPTQAPTAIASNAATSGPPMAELSELANAKNDVPWSQNDPLAGRTDFDNDGVPDMLDSKAGPGATANPQTPWHPNDPLAGRADYDGDGRVDMFDNKAGPGSINSPDAPWDPNSPLSDRSDYDNDRIPDSMDNNLGPGIVGKEKPE